MRLKRVHVQNGRYYYIEDLAERNPRTGRPRQKWHKLTRVDEGDKALHDALSAFHTAPVGDEGNIKEFIDDFLKVKLPELTSIDVRKEYQRQYDIIGEAFAEYDAAEVDAEVILDFLDENFAEHLNARGKFKARLSTFFSWCVIKTKRTGVVVNPCREIKLKGPKKRKGKMNAGIYWRMWDSLPPMGQCFLELTFYTRQRPTEIRLLQESAIGDTHIRFRPTKTEESTGGEVLILITPEIRSALDRARELRPKPKKKDGNVIELKRRSDPYIIQAKGGGKFTKSGLNSLWTRARDDEAKIDVDVTTRDIRPYALIEMERAGFDPRDIQVSAVHSTFTTTEGYLEQHREHVSNARLMAPARPAKSEKL